MFEQLPACFSDIKRTKVCGRAFDCPGLSVSVKRDLNDWNDFTVLGVNISRTPIMLKHECGDFCSCGFVVQEMNRYHEFDHSLIIPVSDP